MQREKGQRMRVTMRTKTRMKTRMKTPTIPTKVTISTTTT